MVIGTRYWCRACPSRPRCECSSRSTSIANGNLGGCNARQFVAQQLPARGGRVPVVTAQYLLRLVQARRRTSNTLLAPAAGTRSAGGCTHMMAGRVDQLSPVVGFPSARNGSGLAGGGRGSAVGATGRFDDLLPSRAPARLPSPSPGSGTCTSGARTCSRHFSCTTRWDCGSSCTRLSACVMIVRSRPSQLNDATLLMDILGYGLYHGKRTHGGQVEDRGENRCWPGLRRAHASRQAGSQVHHMNERLYAFTLCAWRVHGLADTIRSRAQHSWTALRRGRSGKHGMLWPESRKKWIGFTGSSIQPLSHSLQRRC